MKTERLMADEGGVARAGALLAAGRLVAIPTETVYGLAADATSPEAVAGIFAAKGRPSFNPLIVHVGDAGAARRLVRFDAAADRLAAAFWPGPMTLVLPVRDGAGIADLAAAGLPTLAVRVPAHPVAQAVLAAAGRPLAAPSANPSGRVSPTTADHVLSGLGGLIAAVLDAGPCEVGLESTILAPGDQTRLLRPGGLPREAVEACLGQPLAASGAGIEAPGQMTSHYAPRGRMRLNAEVPLPGEVFVGFGLSWADLSLSDTGDLTEAAARLFGVLHRLDAMGAERIAVAPVPDTGLGRAINDRLRRAAAPRPDDPAPDDQALPA